MTDWSKTDALIFDMDGTLWDAVDSYCKVWNECFRVFGVERVVMRDELVACMGLPLEEIYRRVAGDVPVIPTEVFIPRLEQLEKEKGIPVDYMLDRVCQALLTAYKKDNDGLKCDNVYVEPDMDEKTIHMLSLIHI